MLHLPSGVQVSPFTSPLYHSDIIPISHHYHIGSTSVSHGYHIDITSGSQRITSYTILIFRRVARRHTTCTKFTTYPLFLNALQTAQNPFASRPKDYTAHGTVDTTNICQASTLSTNGNYSIRRVLATSQRGNYSMLRALAIHLPVTGVSLMVQMDCRRRWRRSFAIRPSRYRTNNTYLHHLTTAKLTVTTSC